MRDLVDIHPLKYTKTAGWLLINHLNQQVEFSVDTK